MAEKNTLGSRMKVYEAVSRGHLMRKMPVIIRLDGKAFHNFTKGMRRPYDDLLRDTMEQTMLYLCQNIQNVVFGYTQSDEITLVLVDYKDIKTDVWFDNQVQKMVSVAASMATMAFNRIFFKAVEDLLDNNMKAWNVADEEYEYAERLSQKQFMAMFDARVFNLPIEEVANNLIWRQQDATRNSIQMAGQSLFSHKELNGKNNDMIQEMLFQKGINWDNYPVRHKRGSCCYRKEQALPDKNGNMCAVVRAHWFVDQAPPIFTQDRGYIEKHIV